MQNIDKIRHTVQVLAKTQRGHKRIHVRIQGGQKFQILQNLEIDF